MTHHEYKSISFSKVAEINFQSFNNINFLALQEYFFPSKLKVSQLQPTQQNSVQHSSYKWKANTFKSERLQMAFIKQIIFIITETIKEEKVQYLQFL